MVKNIYRIENINEVDSPAIISYPSIIKRNIQEAISIAGDNILRPHIKTAKCIEVALLMIDQGITQFKSATTAEAEMLAMLVLRMCY